MTVQDNYKTCASYITYTRQLHVHVLSTEFLLSRQACSIPGARGGERLHPHHHGDLTGEIQSHPAPAKGRCFCLV